MGFNAEFANWLQRELSIRHWTQNELSTRARVSSQAINSILNQERQPGPKVCNGIANAFDLPPSVVFIKAGLMEPDRKRSPLDQEICHKITLLSGDQKEILLAEIDGIITRNQT